MNVLIFGMTHNPGGMESVIMNYYRAINKLAANIHFDFLTNEESIAYEDEIVRSGSKVYKIPARSKGPLKYRKALKDFFKGHGRKYDAIWVNACSLANIDYLKMAKKYKIARRIIHCHNSQNGESKIRSILHSLNKHAIDKYATDYWACSKESIPWFFGSNKSFTKQIVIINNAIDPTIYKFNKATREVTRKSLGLNGKLIVGHIGRFHPQKNHLFLLEIFKEITKQRKDAHLVLIGQGDEQASILNKIDELKISNSVTILGPRSDIPELLNAFDLFIFPSRFEGFGLSLLEAESVNLPSVASADVIPKEAFVNDSAIPLSLSESASFWATTALSLTGEPRKAQNSFIDDCGFNIKTNAAKMAKLIKGGQK